MARPKKAVEEPVTVESQLEGVIEILSGANTTYNEKEQKMYLLSENQRKTIIDTLKSIASD